MQAVEFHCAHVNTIKSPQMSAWFNFFHSVRQPNWISPKWLSISCLCDEWLSLPGISEPFSHLLNFQITFWAKCAATHFPKIKMNWKKKKLNENETNIQFIESDFKFGEVLFLLFLINCMRLCYRDRVLSLFLCVCVCVKLYPRKNHIQCLNFGIAARWGPGLVQACHWHSIAQRLLVAVTPWPAFPFIMNSCWHLSPACLLDEEQV